MSVQRLASGGRGAVFPSDGKSVPLQVVPWSGQRASTAFNASSARITLPTDSEVIEITATENCYIAFGDNTVDASSTIASDGSRLFLAGVQSVIVPLDGGSPYTHLAVIQQSTAGILQVEKA